MCGELLTLGKSLIRHTQAADFHVDEIANDNWDRVPARFSSHLRNHLLGCVNSKHLHAFGCEGHRDTACTDTELQHPPIAGNAREEFYRRIGESRAREAELIPVCP